MRPLRWRAALAATAAVLALAGCGGADGDPTPAQAAAAPQAAVQAASPVLDAATLLAWAPTAYPQFFSGPFTDGTAFVEGYGTFSYRSWAGTGNAIGLLGGDVYLYGPASGFAIQRVGALADFSCRVYDCGACSGPTPASCNAATATAQGNALCDAVAPFYWEIGDAAGTRISGSRGAAGANDLLKVASASKWIYGSYVVQARGGLGGLSASDIDFLHFTSGYTKLGNLSSGLSCAIAGTVDDCLRGERGTQDARTVGRFDYDSGHMEKHASASMGLGGQGVAGLAAAVRAQLGSDIALAYFEPLLAGGVSTTPADYARMLRKIVGGTLAMRGALGASPVCTSALAPGCNAVPGGSPLGGTGEAWHYAIGHWVEDDPVTGDGAFSSAGAFGFYPWIDAGRDFYGVLARESRNEDQAGWHSAQCGRLIRRAWLTGRIQNGSTPD